MEPEGLLQYSQQPTAVSCLVPLESNSHTYPGSLISVLILSSHLWHCLQRDLPHCFFDWSVICIYHFPQVCGTSCSTVRPNNIWWRVQNLKPLLIFSFIVLKQVDTVSWNCFICTTVMIFPWLAETRDFSLVLVRNWCGGCDDKLILGYYMIKTTVFFCNRTRKEYLILFLTICSHNWRQSIYWTCKYIMRRWYIVFLKFH